MKHTKASLIAAAAFAMAAGMGAAQSFMPAPRKGSNRDYKPRRVATSAGTAMEREIAEHNAEIERRKAEKKAAKIARRAA